MEDFFVNYGITAAIWLTVIAAGLAVLFAIIYTISNLIFSPGETIKSLLGIILMLVIIFVVWTMVDGDRSGIFQAARYSNITDGVMRLVETGIISTIIFAGIAIVAIFLMELFNIVR